MWQFRTWAFVGMLLSATSAVSQTTLEIGSTRDTTLLEDRPANSNGAGDAMVIGTTGRGSPRRALLAFDDLGQIPLGVRVVDAVLRLDLVSSAGEATPISLHRVAASWGEAGSVPSGGPGGGGSALPGDATWTHRDFDDVLWANEGGDFDESPLASTDISELGVYEWRSASLTNLINAWIEGSAANDGLILIGEESVDQTAKVFTTREGASPPTLIVTFDTDNTAEAISINQGLAGAWFDSTTPGQGFLIDIDPELFLLFVAWFTFDAPPPIVSSSKLGSPDQRWLTAQGFFAGDDATVSEDGAVLLTLTNTTGGVFDDSAPVEPGQTVGSMLLRFTSCTSGEISYAFDSEDLAGEISLGRLLPGTAALCETLAELR